MKTNHTHELRLHAVISLEAEKIRKAERAAMDLLEALQNLVNLSYDTARPTKEEKAYNLQQALEAIKKATE